MYMYVGSFVRTSFRRMEFASKFCVKVSQVVYISANAKVGEWGPGLVFVILFVRLYVGSFVRTSFRRMELRQSFVL